MRGVRAGLGVLVGLALVGPVLMGCTDSAAEPDDGASSPRVSAETSASPSPSAPAKPERPEAMNRDDAEGAAAAAEYFIELYPYVMATGDTEEFEAMSHRACGYCAGVLENATWLRDTSATFKGGVTEATLVTTYEQDGVTGVIPFDFATSQSEIWIRDQENDEVDHVARKDFDARVAVGRRDGAWVIIEVAPSPEEER